MGRICIDPFGAELSHVASDRSVVDEIITTQ